MPVNVKDIWWILHKGVRTRGVAMARPALARNPLVICIVFALTSGWVHAQIGKEVPPEQVVEVDPHGRLFKLYEKDQLEDSDFPFCAWQATTDMSVYTPLLLDPNAVYQPLLLSFVASPQRIYRISSHFQQMDYFSYQSYTIYGEALESLIDYHIEPSSGKNPYHDISAAPETSGTYDLHVTRYGTRGLPNELRGCRRVAINDTSSEKGEVKDIVSNVAVLMLRLYSARPPTHVWGNVPPPIIAYSDDDGATWRTMDACDDEKRLRFNHAMKRLGTNLYGLYGLLSSRLPNMAERRCPLTVVPEANVPAMFPNTQALSDKDASEDFVAFSNADSAYAYWCTTRDRLQHQDLILTISGKAPRTPDGLYSGLRIADVERYELRYGSLETAELAIPQPSFASVSLGTMSDFYGPHWDRRYHVVAAQTKEIAERCGLYAPDNGMLFLPFSSADVPSPPVFPSIIWREQLTRDTVLGTKCQTDSVASVASSCKGEKGEKGRCYDVGYIAEKMGPHYPRLEAFLCNRLTGQVTPYHYEPPRRWFGDEKRWWVV